MNAQAKQNNHMQSNKDSYTTLAQRPKAKDMLQQKRDISYREIKDAFPHRHLHQHH